MKGADGRLWVSPWSHRLRRRIVQYDTGSAFLEFKTVRNETRTSDPPPVNSVSSFCISNNWRGITNSGSRSLTNSLRVRHQMAWVSAKRVGGIGPENAVECGRRCGSTKGKDYPNISTIREGDSQLIQSAPGVWGMGARTAGSRWLEL